MRRSALAIATLTLFAASCTTVASSATGPSDQSSAPALDTAIVGQSAPLVAQEASFKVLPADASYIVRPAGLTLDVHDAPDGTPVNTLTTTRDSGSATALAVVGKPGDTWTQVRLAARPNFSTGWVRTSAVDVSWTTLRIVVDLDAHLLTLFNGDEAVVWGTIAIGTRSTPTPRGATYVSELLASPEVDSLYGPFAFGLALFSDTVTEYAGGNGQIGIHGTNRPELLGGNASLGCVRTHNDLIRDLAGRVPLGTPVEIL